MKVLIADFDLFNKIGGGQVFYRSLIEKNPNIEFYYFTINEPVDFSRPKNARTIPYKEKYFFNNFLKFRDIEPPIWVYNAFVKANNIASSVAGLQFDIVDTPDYEQTGILLRPALEHFNVRFNKIALSMHGRISTTIRLNWGTENSISRELNLQEEMQYNTVDIRYGISKAYLDEWRESSNLESHYLDVLRFMTLPEPLLSPASNDPPSLNFIGRTEKRKGPDIFIELAWWLPRSSFSTANIIGPESYDHRGVGSGLYLYQMSQNRLKDVRFHPGMSRDDLFKLFANKSVTFLPSRYDTLNLIAIESLLSGCPTAVGTGAGVCRFFKEKFPNVPFVTIDIKNVYSCLPNILSILQDYDKYRKSLVAALSGSKPQIEGPTIEEIYNNISVCDTEITKQLNRWYSKLVRIHSKSNNDEISTLIPSTVMWIKSKIPPNVRRGLKKAKSNISLSKFKGFVKDKILPNFYPHILRTLDQVSKSSYLIDRYENAFYLPEAADIDLSNKLQQYWGIGEDFKIDRVRIWREIARLERMRGNDLMTATYLLRVMRLVSHDKFGDLPTVVNILGGNGFPTEAKTADAMFGKHSDNTKKCEDLLNEALAKNKADQKFQYEFIDDRRKSNQYKATIIVSMYKAASKLKYFIETLEQQTLLKQGLAELLLIDSGSPEEEYAVFKEYMKTSAINIIYARSVNRETIQCAWNRGVSLAKSPYLAFLGVDEAIVPDCLETLVTELDKSPEIDWVQGSSIVTNVNKEGSWSNDIMLYNRDGYKQCLVYLETCYLSWVGALYRKSIHDRFGYYDPSFGAAGDTEFKNRVLPFIKTKTIPRTLGLFRNYPEERTTHSPRAEIEDLRAWYLHRTLGGVKYAFSNKDPKEAEELLYAALRYRKSYCQHISTDVEYASQIATFLKEKSPNSHTLQYQQGINSLLEGYRLLDYIEKITKKELRNILLSIGQKLSSVEQQHRSLNSQVIDPQYRIFNDNRYEQHSFVWKTDTSKTIT